MAPDRPDGPARSDLLQGTLDVLILKVVALGPIHGYAIARRLNGLSRIGHSTVLSTPQIAADRRSQFARCSPSCLRPRRVSE